ncbi:hypothetical protein [Cryobacterium sp. CG_9.6]|uniref:hypothetical protein n=1 Tax=Cryobacterium sp. CG_9.6 TaxID=2760710 RepID=UPI002473808D|nr:hypothetical protein [Cryobacterium sp. CG_9.6]MDH6237044.1 hypothetical protein [Cryobacterium sp. CG_9.6]
MIAALTVRAARGFVPSKDWNGHTVTSPTGRTIQPDDIDMRILCNADQQTVGGSINRAGYLVTAVR